MPPVPRAFESSYLAGEAIARTFLPLDFGSVVDRIGRTRVAAECRAPDELVAVLREHEERSLRSLRAA